MKFELDTLGIIVFLYILIDWMYMKIKYKEWSKGVVLAGFAIALCLTAIQILQGAK